VHRLTLEINNSIYDHILFFLERLEGKMLTIKRETPDTPSHPIASPKKKAKLPKGFLHPVTVECYDALGSRDELHAQ